MNQIIKKTQFNDYSITTEKVSGNEYTVTCRQIGRTDDLIDRFDTKEKAIEHHDFSVIIIQKADEAFKWMGLKK